MKIYKMFSGALWRRGKMWGGMWFCVFGYGLLIATAPPLLSIARNGYKKRLRKFDVKFRFLYPEKLMPYMIEIIYSKNEISIIVNKMNQFYAKLNRALLDTKWRLGLRTEILFYGRNQTEWIDSIKRTQKRLF